MFVYFQKFLETRDAGDDNIRHQNQRNHQSTHASADDPDTLQYNMAFGALLVKNMNELKAKQESNESHCWARSS